MRRNGRIFEALIAWHEHRDPLNLYHSALEVRLEGRRFVVEMAPVWGNKEPTRGVVCEGPVASKHLGRSRLFRYEVRRWLDGSIADAPEAVASPRRVGGHAGTRLWPLPVRRRMRAG